MRVESPLKSAPPPPAMPVQTVRPRVPSGGGPRRGAAGGGGGRRDGVKRALNFLSAQVLPGVRYAFGASEATDHQASNVKG